MQSQRVEKNNKKTGLLASMTALTQFSLSASCKCFVRSKAAALLKACFGHDVLY